MHDADELLAALAESCPRAAASARHRSPHFDCELEGETGLAVAFADAADHRGSWQQKLAAHWTAVQADPHRDLSSPRGRRRLSPEFLRAENLVTAFTYDGDVLPRTGSVPINEKMIHIVGAVAPCRLSVVAGNGWRGILGRGGEGLVRMSNGNADESGGFSPGVALKFPRSGMASADMLFGPSFTLVGQREQPLEASEFFDIELRTWLGSIPVDPRFRNIRTLFWMFDRMREDTMGCPAFSGRALSPKPLCTHDQDGAAAGAGQDPIGLILRPLPALQVEWGRAWDRNRIRGDRDFRGAFLELPFPLVIYEVLGLLPDRTTRLVGELEITSSFIASPYGDGRLYFRHSPPCPDPQVLE